MINRWPSPATTAPAPAAVAGFFPLDDVLALPPGHLTPQLHEWVVHLGTWVPFRQVPRLLALFAGVSCSAETARRLTEAAGSRLVAVQTAAAPALAPPADPGPDTAAHLQLSADGALVRLQSGEWVEVKTVAVGQVTSQRDRAGQVHPHTSDLSYFSRHAAAAEFTRQAVVELHRRGVRAAAAVAAIQDGAAWLQGFCDYHRPDAVRILDLPHAAEHLGEVAAAVWGEGHATGRAWQAAQIAALRAQGAAPMVAALTALQASDPTNVGLAAQAAYFHKRVAQLDYPAFRAAGWPLGSGVVESANKLVVEARLKGAGMSWGVAALNPMLALRNAVCNDRWTEAWATISPRAKPLRARRAATLAQRPAPEGRTADPAVAAERVNPAVVAEVEAILARVAGEIAQERAQAAPVEGKPGPHHPWRHSPIRRASCPTPTTVENAKL